MLFKPIHRRLSGSRQRPKASSQPVQLQTDPRALHREAAPLDHAQPHGHRIRGRIAESIKNTHGIEHATQPERYG